MAKTEEEEYGEFATSLTERVKRRRQQVSYREDDSDEDAGGGGGNYLPGQRGIIATEASFPMQRRDFNRHDDDSQMSSLYNEGLHTCFSRAEVVGLSLWRWPFGCCSGQGKVLTASSLSLCDFSLAMKKRKKERKQRKYMEMSGTVEELMETPTFKRFYMALDAILDAADDLNITGMRGEWPSFAEIALSKVTG